MKSKCYVILPSAEVLLLVGHNTGDVLVIDMPINPCSCACIVYQPAIPSAFVILTTEIRSYVGYDVMFEY